MTMRTLYPSHHDPAKAHRTFAIPNAIQAQVRDGITRGWRQYTTWADTRYSGFVMVQGHVSRETYWIAADGGWTVGKPKELQ